MTHEYFEKARISVEEKMRYRDLTLQIKRFLRFAPKGTSKDILIREAQEFNRRIASFEDLDRAGVRRLRRGLQKILSDDQ